jgi:uncharacterized repeat protein (TIGR03806 family)
MLRRRYRALAVAAAACAAACGGPQAATCRPGGDGSYLQDFYPTLDKYCVVSLQKGAIVPYAGVTPYDLNTPLFSDSAVKLRTVWMPDGTHATYSATQVFEFPTGTIFTKSFGFRDDLRKPQPALRWIETRVFIKQAAGWKAVSYTWDDAQKTATLDYAGGLLPISWLDEAGNPASAQYLVPNGNQCKECHGQHDAVSNTDATLVIGPKARNLNKTFHYATGDENQLAHWTAAGLLTGAPADPAKAPRLAAWNDPASGTVAERARAYLEVNCAHCHSEGGLARTTGLFLWADVTAPSSYGVCKPPVAVGEASGGFLYDVVPGDPDHSILAFRLGSTRPSVMMPQISRSIVDTAGLALVRDWVTGLNGTVPGCSGR